MRQPSTASIDAATTVERTDPPLRAGEVETLLAYLDFHRDTFRLKVAGLDATALGQRLEPSSMTLGGMWKHLALVEDHWFGQVLLGHEEDEPWRGLDWDADPDWEWRTGTEDGPEVLRPLFDATVERSRRHVEEALADGGLDRLSARESRRPGRGRFSLRWILVHMIEEYARHNGHADLLREAIDGSTGE